MDSRDLVVEVERARLLAMRERIAGLLRQARLCCLKDAAGANLMQCLRGGTRWAGIKLERLEFAPEPTAASEEFNVVFADLERHCAHFEAWMHRQAG